MTVHQFKLRDTRPCDAEPRGPVVPPPERLPLLSGAEVAIMAMQVAAGAFVVYAMLCVALLP